MPDAEAARLRRDWTRPDVIGVVILYTVVVVWCALHHELWRDEVRAASIAWHSRWPWDLIKNLHNEGHPPLWYWLLYVGTFVGRGLWVLKPIAALVGIASAWIFLAAAPFPFWARALFVFGLFPLFEFAVMCRNYGVTLLCGLLVCLAWRQRWDRPWRVGIALALLAQTNVHALLLTAALLLVLGLDYLGARAWRGRGWRSVANVVGAALLVVTVGAWTGKMLKPDRGSVAGPHEVPARERVTNSAKGFVKEPLRVLPEALGMVSSDTRAGAPKPYEKQGFLGFVLFWVFVAWLLYRAWPLAVALPLTGAAMLAFSEIIYVMSTRHHSVFYVALVMCAWIALERGAPRRSDETVRTAFGLLFLTQAALGWHVVKNDHEEALTSAPALATWIKDHREYADATLLAEPDVFMEPLPYYLPHQPLFVAREARPFTGRIVFTTRNAPDYSLRELLDTVDRLKQETGKPVLLMLGLPLDALGYSHRYPYGKSFTHDATSYDRFTRMSKLLAEFNTKGGDENYKLYVFK